MRSYTVSNSIDSPETQPSKYISYDWQGVSHPMNLFCNEHEDYAAT